ncbi:unnamed protein product [Psylliodes chrysocephalus]|uniref:Ribosomal protein S6 kinase delta-1 n=1 Tax=Psylliodes chrysocephalus TaxID=3402493 RepID=A0A9P0CNE6_9CUCU|nr:unnamed protein product [Psylliodes chrysocephala]
MVSVHDKWIRIFDIPDIRKHKSGFTIYKVVSMLYPESCPDAVTKVTVWKRYNDFRRLHRELKSLYKKITKSKDFPNLPAKTLLKRFDEETIQERKQSILNFLDFLGGHYQLFTSKEFVKFLESSHTPSEHLSSNIISIRAELQLPEDPEVCAVLSDDDNTVSDTDSVSTMCSLSNPLQVDILTESTKPNNHHQHSKLHKFSSTASLNSHTSSNNSDLSNITNIFDNISLLDGHSYNIPLIKSLDDNIQYILDASVHINLAAELEEDRKFEEAHVAYNTAIDILSKHGNDDPVYERKQLVKYKINKYRIRADKIYNMHLSPEIKSLEVMNESIEEDTSKRPLFDLYKFKVVKIIHSGILVLHSELQKLFYVKVIHKTTQFLNENLILPENVPYMVKLESHYNCENALFLVLEYRSGMKLSEYLRRQGNDTSFDKDEEFITNQIQEDSDNDSEASFSDLINDYNISRLANSSNSSKTISNREQSEERDSDGSFEKVDVADYALPEEVFGDNKPMNSPDTVLTDQIFHHKYTRRKVSNADKRDFSNESVASNQRKLSEISSIFDFEIFSNRLVVPEKMVVKWAAQLLLALEKLHTLGVICRDLQFKNVLIDDKEDILLTYKCNNKELGDLFSSSINHNLAPEVYSFHQVRNAADWYSFGAILYELLVGMPLSEIHMNGINMCNCLKIPKYVSPQGRSLLKQLLTYDPQERLGTGVNGTENLKSHPFFKSISWDALN